jgi:hypothetical protein
LSEEIKEEKIEDSNPGWILFIICFHQFLVELFLLGIVAGEEERLGPRDQWRRGSVLRSMEKRMQTAIRWLSYGELEMLVQPKKRQLKLGA